MASDAACDELALLVDGVLKSRNRHNHRIASANNKHEIIIKNAKQTELTRHVQGDAWLRDICEIKINVEVAVHRRDPVAGHALLPA